MGAFGNNFVELFEMSEVEAFECQFLAEGNTNCNACNSCAAVNTNPECAPNVGCGCNFSYNGGAGAGTADCCCEANQINRNQKKWCTLEESCCSEYMGELANKRPASHCRREFDPEVLIFGHKMGAEYHKKLEINLGAKDNCCENIYESKLMGSSCKSQTTHHCPNPNNRSRGGCSMYETELINKKPDCCGWPEDEGCGCNTLSGR